MKQSLIRIYFFISLVTGIFSTFFGDYSYKGFMYNLGRGLVWPIGILRGGTELDGSTPMSFALTQDKVLEEHDQAEGRILFTEAMGKISILSYAKLTPTFTQKEYDELYSGSSSIGSLMVEFLKNPAIINDVRRQTDSMDFGDVLDAGNEATEDLKELLSERPYTMAQAPIATAEALLNHKQTEAIQDSTTETPPSTNLEQSTGKQQTISNSRAAVPQTDNVSAEIASTPSPDTPVETVQTPTAEATTTSPALTTETVQERSTEPNALNEVEELSTLSLKPQVIEAAERTNEAIHDSVLPIETPPLPVKIDQSVENQKTPDNNQIQKEREELARYKAKDALDEANKQINIVWNAPTKNIRSAILPEQREWLKQRESDCGLKASAEEPNNNVVQETIKLHCMAAITNERTEILKQKIAGLQSLDTP